MLFTPEEMERIEDIRREILYLRAKTRLLDLELALKAGFNPNQPRVPQGNPDGGQWTRVGGGSASSSRTQQPTATRDSTGTQQLPVVRDSVGNVQQLVRDETGEQPWSSHLDTLRPDGSLAQQHVINRDGSRIVSEFAAPDAGVAWDVRHTVTAADGRRIVIEISGLVETFFDADGQFLGQAAWTSVGPEPEATVQPAFAPAVPLVAPLVTTTIELGLVLFTWLSSRSVPGKLPVIAFVARDYPRSEADTFELSNVNLLSREDVGKACELLGEVQRVTNEAVSNINRDEFSSPAVYGTKVHLAIEREIKKLSEREHPNLSAEVSLRKTLAETGEEPWRAVRGELGSIRIDVLEDVNGEGVTICVYDIKTGLKGLSSARFQEIVRTVLLKYPNARRIIITEMRPFQGLPSGKSIAPWLELSEGWQPVESLGTAGDSSCYANAP